MKNINYLNDDLFIKSNCIFKSKKELIFREKNYSKKMWLAKTCQYSISNGELKENINPSFCKRYEIYYRGFLENAKKYTKNGGILPGIVFLSFSLISFNLGLFFQINENFGFDWISSSANYFMMFVGILFFAFALIFLINFIILKNKLIFTIKYGHFRYECITYEKYVKICDDFEQKIANKSIYFEPIFTDRLIIREFSYDDVDDIYDFGSNSNYVKYLNTAVLANKTDAFKYVEACRQSYEQNFLSKLAIVNKETCKVMGFIGLSKYEYSVKTCQIIYGIGENYWYNGYVLEATNAFVKYLFEKGKEIIYAGHVLENINSGKVLLKAGFRRIENKDYDLMIRDEKKHILSYILEKEDNDNEK